MLEIFKAELLRFRAWALVLGLLHLFALAFTNRMVDLAQQPLAVYMTFGALYALLGVLFGAFQMGTYRKPSAWLNLLHRPVASWRIAVALMVASAVLLFVAVAVPALIVALWQKTMTPRVVDLRHWLLALAALQLGIAGYLAGAYAMLADRRYSAAGFVFLFLLLVAHATGFGALALQVLVIAWVAVMVLGAFKPDLSAAPRPLLPLVSVAIPLQMLAMMVLVTSYMAVEMAWIAHGSHPNNTSTPPVGGHNEVEKMDDRSRMIAALRGSTHPDAALLREQIALSDPMAVSQQIRRLPYRNDLANLGPMEFDDDAHGIRWVFSHDDMRLHGYDLRKRSAVGALGVGAGNAPFEAPAQPIGGMRGMARGDAVLLAGNTMYQYTSADRRVSARIRLPAGEVILGASPIGESLGVISATTLYFFDGRGLVEHASLLEPRMRLAIPGPSGALSSLELMELIDGYLMVATFSSKLSLVNGGTPYQSVMRVRDDGRSEEIARRTLAHDYPAVHRYQWFWTSPVLTELERFAHGLFAPPMPQDATVSGPIPRAIWWLALALCALSGITAAWRSRVLPLSARLRAAWIATCALVGLPALVAMWLLYRPREDVSPAA